MHPIHRMRIKSIFYIIRIAVILVIKETCTVHHQDLLVETTNGINNT